MEKRPLNLITYLGKNVTENILSLNVRIKRLSEKELSETMIY